MKHTTFAAPHPPPLLVNLRRPCSSNHLLFLHAHRLLSSLHFMRCCIAFGSATTPRRSTLVFLVYSCVLLANLWSPSRLPACLPPFRVTYLAFTSPAVEMRLGDVRIASHQPFGLCVSILSLLHPWMPSIPCSFPLRRHLSCGHPSHVLRFTRNLTWICYARLLFIDCPPALASPPPRPHVLPPPPPRPALAAPGCQHPLNQLRRPTSRASPAVSMCKVR